MKDNFIRSLLLLIILRGCVSMILSPGRADDCQVSLGQGFPYLLGSHGTKLTQDKYLEI